MEKKSKKRKSEKTDKRGTNDEILKKARKSLPPLEDGTEIHDLEIPPPAPIIKVKKARKTVRGQDGLKIRPAPVPTATVTPKTKSKSSKLAIASTEEENTTTSKTKKKSKKKKKSKTPETAKTGPAGGKKTDAVTQQRYAFESMEYVKMWKHKNAEWKFEKLKQVWLLNNLLDESAVSEEDFDLALEYVASIQGKARGETLKEMTKIVDAGVKEGCDHDLQVKYERARSVVQTLSDDD